MYIRHLILAIFSSCLFVLSWLDQASAAQNHAGSHADGYTQPAGTTDWIDQSAYWQQNYSSRPYYNSSEKYSAYEPAYHYGTDSYNRYSGRPFNQIDETELRQGWEKTRGNAGLSWEKARGAVKDAYERLYNSQPMQESGQAKH